MFNHIQFTDNPVGFNSLPFNHIPEVAPPSDLPVARPNDLTLIYDTDVVPLQYIGDQQAFTQSPWTPHDGFAPLQWMRSRELNLYLAGNDGYVYEYGVGDTDSGRKIDDYLITAGFDLGSPDLKKRLRWIDIDADSEPGSFVRVYYRVDGGSWQLLCEIEQGNFKYPFVSFPRPMFRNIELKFSSGYVGCKYKINAFVLDMVVHGQQKEMI